MKKQTGNFSKSQIVKTKTRISTIKKQAFQSSKKQNPQSKKSAMKILGNPPLLKKQNLKAKKSGMEILENPSSQNLKGKKFQMGAIKNPSPAQQLSVTDQKALQWFDKYLRYTNYLGAAQLYFKNNFFCRRKLSQSDMKERVLGHWGTVPGLNFLYAHLNYLVWKHQAGMLFIAGPGHGAPAVIANLFAENTLAEFYKDLERDEKGMSKLIKMFSWPGGFPSHTNPGTPGAILEGGELGYSLATAYGAVMDNPDLIAACIVGDGEAETGPLAAAWQSNKFLNPVESGAVLPILLANGYKITGPTLYASMNDDELTQYFSGLGYEPRIVDDRDAKSFAHEAMMETLEWAYQKIRTIQKQARGSKKLLLKPRWPMIVFRTLKGKTGIKFADGHKVEGTYHAHGIPLHDPAQNKTHFELVRKWLESYKFSDLVDAKGRPKPEVVEFVPRGNLRMGMNKHAFGGNLLKALKLPDPKHYQEKITPVVRGQLQASNTTAASAYIRDIIKSNQKNFRFMCPDETESNKFQSLFEVTKRAFMWPLQAYDENLAPNGRVMEVLSEHTLQGWLQGYLLTGRHGIFVTYEAFAPIVASMVDQYAKFLKQSMKVPFRKPVSSLNYLLTSVGWRQEHNGYSHQNPSFVSNVLEKHGKFCSVYFPADANSLLVTLEECFQRKNSINVIVAGKQNLPQWLTLKEARAELQKGVGIWEWVDPKGSKNPDVVFAAAGDALVVESLAAISILKKMVPELRLRFVNVSELTALGVGDERHPLSMSDKDFYKYFTKDRSIIFNFHGYPGVIKKLIYGHTVSDRFSIHGYMEEGTTTTPFDMMVLNQTSRYHLVMDAIDKAAKINPAAARAKSKVQQYCKKMLAQHAKYIRQYGKDMEEVDGWKWTG